MSDGKSTEFDVFSKLPAHLVTTNLQVMKFARKYIKLEGDDKRWFDWPSFRSAVDGYNGDDLKLDNIKTTTIAQSESTVKTMVDKIVEYLVGVLMVVVDGSAIQSLTAAIEATFANLKKNSSSGFLDFDTSSNGQNSSWEYRTFIVLPDPKFLDTFYSSVTTIRLVANVTTKVEWWGLVKHTSNFSAIINAMQLVVKEGFTNPDPNLASFSGVSMGPNMEQLGFDIVVGSVRE